jgi:hypothetical protein
MGVSVRTVDPGPADDRTSAFDVGDLWVNQIGLRCFIAVNVTPGAAVWVLSGSAPSRKS